MKYLILIYSNPASREAWEQLSDEERAAMARERTALNEELADSGELVVAEGLADPTHAKRVSVTGGELLTTDGPFPEMKEHLAGIYLVECESTERAIEVTSRLPDARRATVELRPVLDRSELDV